LEIRWTGEKVALCCVPGGMTFLWLLSIAASTCSALIRTYPQHKNAQYRSSQRTTS
jgi:hypothetical protein